MTQNLRNLNDIMQAEVDRHVDAFMQDLALDFEDLKREGGNKRYVWLLRDCGTTLIRQECLAYRNTSAFVTFSYYTPNLIRAAFELEVESVDGDLLIGSLNPIQDHDAYYQKIRQGAGWSERAIFEVEQTTGQITQHQIEIGEEGILYAECLRLANIPVDQVARFKVLSYE